MGVLKSVKRGNVRDSMWIIIIVIAIVLAELLFDGCAAYRLPSYKFTTMEQQWILEARQQGYPVQIRCPLHGRPDNRWPVDTRQRWCLVEAGGKWIADI